MSIGILEAVRDELIEVVLFVRPLCSPFKVDQGFILGC